MFGIIAGLLAAFPFGLSYVFFRKGFDELDDSYGKLTLETYGFSTFLFCLGIAQPIVAWLNLLIRKQSLSGFGNIVFKHNYTKRLAIGSLLNIVGLIFFWYAFDLLYTGIASSLTGVYPVIMVLFAYFFLDEKVTKIQYIGIGIVFITVYVFSIYSV